MEKVIKMIKSKLDRESQKATPMGFEPTLLNFGNHFIDLSMIFECEMIRLNRSATVSCLSN